MQSPEYIAAQLPHGRMMSEMNRCDSRAISKGAVPNKEERRREKK
jgi:hypothetical protein